MAEIHEICREAAAIRSRKEAFLLATVVRVLGSAYRRPGARMLVADDRWIAGSVSGGCLEQDVLVRGAFRTRSGAPVLVTYDTAGDDEIGFVLGSGCAGTVDVFLERIDENTELDPVRFAGDCFRAEEVGALATVFASDDPDAVLVGARVAVRQNGDVTSTVPDGPLRDDLAEQARMALRDDGFRNRVHVHGGVEALVERFAPPPHLFVIGRRHDARELVVLAPALGFGVTMAECSASRSDRVRFACADRIVAGPPSEIAHAIERHVRSVVVLMTHDYRRDAKFLVTVLGTRARYIGVLGPRARTVRMLAESGIEITHEMRSRIHAPAGLDLGAETPREVAFAILAEIEATLKNASAARLRERRGPIHAPGDAKHPPFEMEEP